MGTIVSTDDEMNYIGDITDETIKENAENFIKEHIRKRYNNLTFLVCRWYNDIDPKYKNKKFFLDKYTLNKLIKEIATDDYIISHKCYYYWNISFIQRNFHLKI
jgi:hypothetical protein